MTDIDVEAVEEIDPPTGVDAPEYVLYGGKGGVGKTTMAAATALASARDGTATLVVSTDPAHSLADTLETPVPSDPGRIREDVPLYAAEIDPEEATQDGLFGGEGGLGGMESLLGGGGPAGGPGEEGVLGEDADPLAGQIPGADEAAAMQLLLEYMDDDRFERVIVDTAPTGHTLRLLELPEAMDSMLGRVVRMREQLSGLFDGLSGMFGGDEETPEGEMGGLAEADLDELRERIQRLRAVLLDPDQTDFRIVLVPEELSVEESKRLLDQLEGFGVPVGTVVVNRVMQDLGDVLGEDVPDADLVGPNLEDCAFCARRWEVQQDALAAAQDLFRGKSVKRVPLLAEEVRGERMLAVVAACLD